jgi:hypothetical protein
MRFIVDYVCLQVTIGQAPTEQGHSRTAKFDITVASEVCSRSVCICHIVDYGCACTDYIDGGYARAIWPYGSGKQPTG